MVNGPRPQPPTPPDPEAAAKALAVLGQQVINAFRKRQSGKEQDRAVSLWVLGLIPIIFACLHLMIVSRGDAQTLRSLVQNLNVTALVLAIILPLGSTILLWAFLFVFLTTITTTQAQRAQGWRTSTVLFVVAAFVAFFAMPVDYGLVNFVILTMLIAFIVASRWTMKREGRWVAPARKFFKFSAFVWALVFFLGPLLIWLGFLGVWMPQERIATVGEVIEPAYVLAYDDHWMHYMDSAHKVHILPTHDIIRRELLAAPASVWRKTPYALWQPHFR